MIIGEIKDMKINKLAIIITAIIVIACVIIVTAYNGNRYFS